MVLGSGRFATNARLQQAAGNSPSMKEGERGDPVAIVQQALVDLGFSMPITTSGGRALADGIYGGETTRVVKQFQGANRLVVDGIVGRDTLARLDAAIAAQSALKESQDVFFSSNEFSLRTAKPSG